MALETMPNEVLLNIFRSLYPLGFFSDIDWLAAYGLEDEGDVDDEDEDEDEEAGSGEQEEYDGAGVDNENDDSDLSDDGDEDQHVDDKEDLETASSTSSTDSRTAREIAAWEQVKEADETMKSVSRTCRHLRAISNTILQDHVRMEIEKQQRRTAHLDWDIIRDFHGTKLSDAKGEYPNSLSDWNKTWGALGERLRRLHVPAWVVEQEEDEIADLLRYTTEKAQQRENCAFRRSGLWWPRPRQH
ncbi:hypothetical protein N7G274_009426 [Stereocaulon virgatum]|uniref:F-box domain-containing protein n=1 Tax=Stereocaulon virgatum TaxID=373712 RepID=A0ABR3ZYX6_9LECA